MSTPSFTPNVRVENPKVRKIVGDVLGWGTVALAAAGIVDGAIQTVDWSDYLIPAGTILGAFLGLWQVLVTSPNVPTEHIEDDHDFID